MNSLSILSSLWGGWVSISSLLMFNIYGGSSLAEAAATAEQIKFPQKVGKKSFFLVRSFCLLRR
jgi:hypothetical protein